MIFVEDMCPIGWVVKMCGRDRRTPLLHPVDFTYGGGVQPYLFLLFISENV